MSVQMNIERQPVIQQGNLIMEFDVLHLLMQYFGWVLSFEQIYDVIWKGRVTGCEHVVYNVIC